MNPIVVRHGTTLARLGRARTENENELGVLGSRKGGTTRLLGTVHVRRDAGNLSRRIAIVEVEITSYRAQHAIERTRRRARHSRSVRNVHRLVTVLVNDFPQFGRSDLGSLVPADTLILALAALAHALHGIVDAIGMIHPTTIAATTQTGARLRIVEIRILAGVGVNPHHFVVLHVELQAATARAVDGAVAPGDLLLAVGGRLGHAAAAERIGRSRAADGGQRAERSRRLHERATAQSRHCFRHCTPPSSRTHSRQSTPTIPIPARARVT